MLGTKGHEVIPSARRLIKSLRDMGYDFPQAVSDVVDNSIEAGATHVAINVVFEGDDSYVRIADNGKGMSPDQLREAMRYGAEREYGQEDLGKFGLGLKTASMSQCQCLTVASRWSTERAKISSYAWDLDHIADTDRWEILPIERGALDQAVVHHLTRSTGTVVVWKRLDRILGYQQPYGEMARKRLFQMCRDLELHLAMVFHRFLELHRKRRLSITLNGNDVVPWDPFCRTEKTSSLQPIRLPVNHEGVSGEILLEPFVLPNQESFSSPLAFKHASGPSGWNQQQGFYIYRADRMIQSGGWCRLRAADEHLKLARIAIRFPPSLDDAFKINVAKMRVQLPTGVRDDIETAIRPVMKLAREAYDKKTKVGLGNVSLAPAITKPIEPTAQVPVANPATANPATGSREAITNSTLPDRTWTIDEIQQQCVDFSDMEEKPVIQRVFRRVRDSLK